jgi:TPR repeat protein
MKNRYWIFGAWLSAGVVVSASAAGTLTASEQQADAEVRFQSARASLRGESVPKDVRKAFELMKSAAALGHADATGGVGYFYSAGVAVEKNDQLAEKWFRKGAEMGSAKARLNLGKMLMDRKSEERGKGLRWIKQAADQGLPEAELCYGSMLYFGDHGVTKDYAEAARYLKPAAEEGNPEARNFLGLMNQLGLGVPVDASLAEQWFRKAAMQGHAKAQSNLGQILDPLAVDKETRIEALAWLVMAWRQGEVTAQKSLEDAGPCLKEGEFEAAKSRADEFAEKIVK